jgi:hypothetical protein
MDMIRQVDYELELDIDDNDVMLDVFEVNMLLPVQQQRSHWRRFPAAYFTFMKCLLYCFELYIDVHDIVTSKPRDYPFSKDTIQKLKHYIQYMDGVFMEAWEQCRIAGVADELGPDWRCPAINRWLCLEFYVSKHDILDVELYVRTSGVGLNDDPFEFGMLEVYSCVYSFTCIFRTDWIEYEASVPKWHHGEEYKYEIASMKEEALHSIIPKVMLWLEDESDTSDEGTDEDASDEETEGEAISKVKGKLFIIYYPFIRLD